MSFNIHDLNENSEDNIIQVTDKSDDSDNPPFFTMENPSITSFPIANYTTLENKLNFTFKYLLNKDIENNLIEEDYYEFNEVEDGSSLNNTFVKVFLSHFEINAQFSIRIKQNTAISNTIYFEYTPENISDIQDFIRQIGQNDFIPVSGIINATVSDYEDTTVKLYTNSILERYNDNILKNRICINFIDLFQEDGDTVYISSQNYLKKDLLLNLNCYLNYKIVYK